MILDLVSCITWVTSGYNWSYDKSRLQSQCPENVISVSNGWLFIQYLYQGQGDKWEVRGWKLDLGLRLLPVTGSLCPCLLGLVVAMRREWWYQMNVGWYNLSIWIMHDISKYHFERWPLHNQDRKSMWDGLILIVFIFLAAQYISVTQLWPGTN